MTSPKYDPRDVWLLSELKAASTDPFTDPVSVPAGARETAQALFTWRTIDNELTLALCFDSALDALDDPALDALDDPALVRGPCASTRTLSFENHDLGIDLEIETSHLTGQLLPPQTGTVRLVTTHGPYAHTTTDDTGCFLLRRPLHGPLRLECHTTHGPILLTEWLFL